MMRLVREHIREHYASRRPHRSPTAAREFCDPPLRPAGQRIRQHAQALCCALSVGRGSLLHCAFVWIECRRTLQIRRRVFQPHQPAIVQMRKDCSDRASTSLFAGRIRSPSPRIEVSEQDVVHGVVDGISLDQNSRKFSRRVISNFVCTRIRSSFHATSVIMVPDGPLTAARHSSGGKLDFNDTLS